MEAGAGGGDAAAAAGARPRVPAQQLPGRLSWAQAAERAARGRTPAAAAPGGGGDASSSGRLAVTTPRAPPSLAQQLGAAVPAGARGERVLQWLVLDLLDR
jgi:hypothetical protein